MLRDTLRLQMDAALTLAEFGWSVSSLRKLDRCSPKGDGTQPVLLIPGFNASENSLGFLRRFLRRNGFDAHGWGLGINHGPRQECFDTYLARLTDELQHRVESLANRHGRAVSLIGHSLGGVCARELAPMLAPFVDRVITLGAPSFPRGDRAQHNAVLQLMGELKSGRPLDDTFFLAGTTLWPAHDPAMPLVAVMSPIDAAVSKAHAQIPQCTVERSKAPAIRENIRIFSSHIGMGVNPRMLLCIADRLCADVDNWKSFDPRLFRKLYLPSWAS